MYLILKIGYYRAIIEMEITMTKVFRVVVFNEEEDYDVAWGFVWAETREKAAVKGRDHIHPLVDTATEQGYENEGQLKRYLLQLMKTSIGSEPNSEEVLEVQKFVTRTTDFLLIAA